MYGYSRKVAASYADAVERTRDELKKEGFGVLTEIDVRATLREKLNVEFGNYIILGACNPSFAHQALQVEREIGLLMPCNVIVYEQDGGSVVSAVLPTVAMQAAANEALRPIAEEVEQKLRKVVDGV